MIVPHHILPEYPRASSIREDQGGQYAEYRSLARTVRSDDAEYLPCVHTERHPAESLVASVPLDEIIGLDTVHDRSG